MGVSFFVMIKLRTNYETSTSRGPAEKIIGN